ncbi:hypothetical protein BJ165DRAFT_1529855 [Panaeolus papilionaceus]|nr:hypothetical protein BJ165DRAFT_1529855 [Panaeolus papilionaceus]
MSVCYFFSPKGLFVSFSTTAIALPLAFDWFHATSDLHYILVAETWPRHLISTATYAPRDLDSSLLSIFQRTWTRDTQMRPTIYNSHLLVSESNPVLIISYHSFFPTSNCSCPGKAKTGMCPPGFLALAVGKGTYGSQDNESNVPTGKPGGSITAANWQSLPEGFGVG